MTQIPARGTPNALHPALAVLHRFRRYLPCAADDPAGLSGLTVRSIRMYSHVSIATKRHELMTLDKTEHVTTILQSQPQNQTINITGSVLEMNPHFHYLVAETSALGHQEIDR